MTHIQQPLGLALIFVASTSLFGQELHNNNPYCKIAFVSPPVVYFSEPAEVLTDGFAVQLTDSGGIPLEGLEVEIGVNRPTNFPGLPPDPTPPEAWGRFENSTAPSHESISVVTDALGTARSGPFTAGALGKTYGVSANVYISFYPANTLACKVVPGPSAVFYIVQAFSPPNPLAVPTTSLPTLLSLIAVTALIAARYRPSK